MNAKHCACCHGKLGLGTRFRNLFQSGRWQHLRFCSKKCEDHFEKQRHAATAKDRFLSFLAGGNPGVAKPL